ncbi:MAG: CPBP family intramembrane metalloprotease [Verrucomicrobiales bacterium]|nr:CPBP family intramembrane metalloprotease [Verrucomicrobiales bacterium]
MGDVSLITGFVLRDFTIIVLAAMLLGLFAHAVMRGIRGKSSRRPAAGVDVSHFTSLDFFVCFIVLSIFLARVFAVEVIHEAMEKAGEQEMTADTAVFGFVAQIIEYLLFGGIIIVMLKWVGQRDPAQVFGLRHLPLRKILIWVVIGGILGVVGATLINFRSTEFVERAFGESELQPAVESLASERSPVILAVLIISPIIVAPLFEELVFRGYFYGILKKYTDPMFSALISGAIFGAIHLNAAALLPLWFFGIFLALSYEFTRSLWVPIGIHALFNANTVFWLLFGDNFGFIEEPPIPVEP